MAHVKSASALHDDLVGALTEHTRRREETLKRLEANDYAALLGFGREANRYAESLAYLLSEVIHTLGALAVDVGKPGFALGQGVEFGDGLGDLAPLPDD